MCEVPPMKYRSARAVEKSTIRDITNGIRANVSLSTVWFEDKPGKSWWACNIPIESHQNERSKGYAGMRLCS